MCGNGSGQQLGHIFVIARQEMNAVTVHTHTHEERMTCAQAGTRHITLYREQIQHQKMLSETPLLYFTSLCPTILMLLLLIAWIRL